MMPHPDDTLSGYGAVVSAQSANHNHSVVTPETTMCHMFGFVDNLQLDHSTPFIKKKTYSQWADEVFNGSSVLPAIYRHLVFFFF